MPSYAVKAFSKPAANGMSRNLDQSRPMRKRLGRKNSSRRLFRWIRSSGHFFTHSLSPWAVCQSGSDRRTSPTCVTCAAFARSALRPVAIPFDRDDIAEGAKQVGIIAKLRRLSIAAVSEVIPDISARARGNVPLLPQVLGVLLVRFAPDRECDPVDPLRFRLGSVRWQAPGF